jgi:hypothetical protein
LSERPAPDLTIVIAASDSAEAVERTLASLGGSTRHPRCETLVVAARDRIPPPTTLRDHVFWEAAEPGSGVPRLRRLGLDRARGDVVVFTEDSCTLAPGWAEAWIAAFADPDVMAATGLVVPSMGDRPIDWAVFFCEYAPFVPERKGPTSMPSHLAGNNFAVRRSLSWRIDPTEVHEVDVHRLTAVILQGLTLAPAAIAGHSRRYRLTDAIRDRLSFGREYGRLRASRLPRLARLAGFAVGPAVLLTQAARMTLTVVRRGRDVGVFLETLPLTLGLLTTWSVGEWLGWISAALGAAGSPVCHTQRERAARPRARSTGRPRSPRPHCREGQSLASLARSGQDRPGAGGGP